MSLFDRTQLPHPYLPGEWGPTPRADETAKAPALPDINPAALAVARIQQRAEELDLASAGGANGFGGSGGPGGSENPNGPIGPAPGTGSGGGANSQETYESINHINLGLATLEGGLQFSFIGGEASLIGFSEMLDHNLLGDDIPDESPATVPWVKYLKKTYSGEIWRDNYTQTEPPTCANIISTGASILTGTASYDALTGELTYDGTVSVTGDGGWYCPGSLNPTQNIPGYYVPQVEVDNLNLHSETVRGTDVCDWAGDEFQDHHTQGYFQCTLSQPDTESNAIKRYETAHSWSAWSANAVTAGTEQRTTSYSFGHIKFKFKGSWTGAAAGWPYRIVIQMQGRVYNTGNWVDEEALEPVVFADDDGKLTLDEIAVEAAVGRQKQIKSVNIIDGG